MWKIITVNTDASYCPKSWLVSYWYWIKWPWFHFKGWWKFKKKMTSSTEAEVYWVMVAIYILDKYRKDFDCLIINCDNTSIGKRWTKDYFYELINQIDKYKKSFWDNKFRRIQYRYVESHTSWDEAREYVNNRCDKESRKHLKEMRTLNNI